MKGKDNPDGMRAKFHFSNHSPISGRVVYVPVATGDYWIVEVPRSSDGVGLGRKFRKFYIQSFQYMEVEDD